MHKRPRSTQWPVVDDASEARKSCESRGLTFLAVTRVEATPAKRTITFNARDHRGAVVTRRVRV